MIVCSHGVLSPCLETPRPSEAAIAQLSSFASARGSGATVAAGEFFDPPRGIDKFLFAGEKRMTSGANTDLNIPARRAGMIHRAARANHVGLVIFWMNPGFHLRKGARNLAASGRCCKR
jgi:hypothetical protein